MIKTMGFDLSITQAGVAYAEDGVVKWVKSIRTLPASQKSKSIPAFSNFYSRTTYIVNEAIKLIPLDVNLIVVEDVYAARGKSMGSAMDLIALGHLFRHYLEMNKLPWVPVTPSSLKMCLGNGNLPKDQVTKELFKLFGVDVSNDDEADAANGAIFAHMLIQKKQGISPPILPNFPYQMKKGKRIDKRLEAVEKVISDDDFYNYPHVVVTP